MKMEGKLFKSMTSAALIVVMVMSIVSIPVFNGNNKVDAASKKMKISKKKATLNVGKRFTLSVKRGKKKVKVKKWTSSNKKVATVSKKGRIVAKRAGKTTITAKVGKKKFRCKITVKNPRGTVKNPADPRSGITVNGYYGRFYFKLNSIVKGQAAIDAMKAMDEWGVTDSVKPGTTLMLFTFDTKAISGHKYVKFTGLHAINPAAASRTSGGKGLYIEQHFLLGNSYGNLDPVDLRLKNGQSSKMYMALNVPNGMKEFYYGIYTPKGGRYWTKYSL